MSRRIDIELTSSREDGSWTWRAAGAREPKGTVDGAILPGDAAVGQVLRAEIEGYLDGLSVVAVLPPRAPRREPERLEIKPSRGDQPLVTSTLAPKRSGERGRRGDRRDRREGDSGPGRRERRGGRDRDEGRRERPSRPAPPPVPEKPKPKRLRPGKAHRTALLEAVPAEQRPIAEQLLAGGIPSVRQAIDKQNKQLREEGKPEVKADALLRVAEDLRPRAQAALWRDRAEAAAAVVDELDLRDLRSVVNAAGDAGRDEEARALAAQLREALANRVEKEHSAWLAELAETVQAGRVVRALRLSSRPPKAGAPIPGDVATQLAEATAASLTEETGQERWATVLDALAYSPVRRRVIPQSLPAKLTSDLRNTIARLASRLPEIAHIFDIEPDPNAERAARGGGGQARRRQGRKGDERKAGQPRGERKGGKGGERPRGGKPRAGSSGEGAPAAEARTGADDAETPAAADQPAPAETAEQASEAAPTAATTPSGDITTDEPAAPPEPTEASIPADTSATDKPATAGPTDAYTPADTATTDDPADAAPTEAGTPAEASTPADATTTDDPADAAPAEASIQADDATATADDEASSEPTSNGNGTAAESAHVDEPAG